MKSAFHRHRKPRRNALRRHPTPWRFGWREAGGTLLAALVAVASWSMLPDGAGAAAGTSAPLRFGFCQEGGGRNCVVDGDTFRMHGTRIRIADIDTPETHPARCAREAMLGEAATRRLHALLNGGAIAIAPAGDRDTDRYGRQLRLVEVDGVGIGDTLIAEGLARPYTGGWRAGWC